MSDVLLDLNPPSAVTPQLLAGRRATARVATDAFRLDKIAAAPAEAFRSVEFQSKARCTRTRLYPNHMVKNVTEASGQEATWRFFAAAEAPWSAVLIERGEKDRWPMKPFAPTVSCKANLDYLHNFKGTGAQSYQRIERGVAFTVTDHPELMAVLLTDGAIGGNPEAAGAVDAEKSLGIPISFASSRGFVLFLVGKAEEIQVMIPDLTYESVEAELARVQAETEYALAEGIALDTPDETLNTFFAQSRMAFHKAVRRLPLGAPFSKNAAENLDIEVTTASADAQGVFAHDSVQSAIEGLFAAPSLQPVFENNLEVLKQHAANCQDYYPEAVELSLGAQELFIETMKRGQHPQWIATAANMILLTGDRELGERLWPGIEAARKFFKHSGDNVNLWDDQAYPKGSETTGYQNGLLYAQAWWVWACERSLEVARFLDKGLAETTLRLRYETAKKALEENFATETGYASWRNATGQLHPHTGHAMILPVALGITSKEKAQQVLKAMLNEKQWLQSYGPRRANLESGVVDGEQVFNSMRWDFISALLAGGQADLAARLAVQWAGQEMADGLPALATLAPSTGQGCVGAAARAIRALSFGLFGIRPMADGLFVAPQLPKDWPEMNLSEFAFRGKALRIRVVRGQDNRMWLNGRFQEETFIPEKDLIQGANSLEIHQS